MDRLSRLRLALLLAMTLLACSGRGRKCGFPAFPRAGPDPHRGVHRWGGGRRLCGARQHLPGNPPHPGPPHLQSPRWCLLPIQYSGGFRQSHLCIPRHSQQWRLRRSLLGRGCSKCDHRRGRATRILCLGSVCRGQDSHHRPCLRRGGLPSANRVESLVLPPKSAPGRISKVRRPARPGPAQTTLSLYQSHFRCPDPGRPPDSLQLPLHEPKISRCRSLCTFQRKSCPMVPWAWRSSFPR